MPEQPRPQRKSPRLQGYDYSQEGAYFVTICTYQRIHLFGDVVNGEMQFSDLGQIAHRLWATISDHRSNVVLDGYVVMPNHMHGIIFINSQQSSSQITVGMRRASSDVPLPQKLDNGARSRTLGTIIGAYKSVVTRTINRQMGLRSPMIWQNSFHDHIIRNEQALNHIREYVYTNPSRWAEDKFYS